MSTISKHLVAVYGSLRKTKGNHNLLYTGKHETEYIGTESLKGNFTMVSLGGYPGVIQTPDKQNEIVIELYKVNDVTALNLDNLEGFHSPGSKFNFYDKIQIETSKGIASMYTLGESYLDHDEVESGDWVKYTSK